MTGKRFKYVEFTKNVLSFDDNGVCRFFREQDFEDWLNELAEENEQLRKEKIDAEVKLYSANEKILMQMDYDEIIKQNTENEIEITNLKKENGQLKKKTRNSNNNYNKNTPCLTMQST